MEEDD